MSLAAYSFYSLTTFPAYPGDSNVPAPKTPGDAGPVKPLPTPISKPGFQPLAEGTKGAYVGVFSVSCGRSCN